MVLITAAVVLSAAASTTSPVSMSGLYRAGELGIVDVSVIEGRLSARYRGAGNCGFKNEMQVLSGTFEGDVFLGTVFVCQSGPSCEKEKAFPFMAVLHEGTLAGDVKLDVGCTSAGLEGKRLNVVVASADDKLLASHHEETSAAAVAGKNSPRHELEKLALENSRQGQLKMKELNFAAAKNAFERALSYDDSDWKTWAYLSQVELRLNNVTKGLESIQKAMVSAQKGKSKLNETEMGELFYNQACALSRNNKKKEAISTLRNALKVGDTAFLLRSAEEDTDLDVLRDEAEFRKLIADLKPRKERHGQ